MAIAGFPADGGVARVIAPAKSDLHILPLPAYVHHSAVGGMLRPDLVLSPDDTERVDQS